MSDKEAVIELINRVEEDKKRISIARFWHSAQKQLKL
jgi:hypothetical protein